jgi:uncharacterized protein YkuJ
MDIEYGIDKKMNVDSELEKDGTLCFKMDFFEHDECYDLSTYIDRDQAIKLVEHLKRLFET